MENPFALEVYRTIRRVSQQLKDELHKKLEDSGITWPQFHALYHIGDEGIPPNELAKELNCNASNMTGLVDRMIENGWVYREHSEKDRRVWLVKLTEEGAALKADLLPKHQQNIHNRMSVLSYEELYNLNMLLNKLSNRGEKESDR